MWITCYELKFKNIFLSTGNNKNCVQDDIESFVYKSAAKYFFLKKSFFPPSNSLMKWAHKEKSAGTVKIFGRESNI